jgi:hypothetical protein
MRRSSMHFLCTGGSQYSGKNGSFPGNPSAHDYQRTSEHDASTDSPAAKAARASGNQVTPLPPQEVLPTAKGNDPNAARCAHSPGVM